MSAHLRVVTHSSLHAYCEVESMPRMNGDLILSKDTLIVVEVDHQNRDIVRILHPVHGSLFAFAHSVLVTSRRVA